MERKVNFIFKNQSYEGKIVEQQQFFFIIKVGRKKFRKCLICGNIYHRKDNADKHSYTHQKNEETEETLIFQLSGNFLYNLIFNLVKN